MEVACIVARGGLAAFSRLDWRWIVIAMIALLAAAAAAGAQPSAATVKAFDDYVAKAEERIRREESSVETFVIAPPGAVGARQVALGRGEVVVEQRGTAMIEIPGGLIHHWIGTVLIPGATVADVLGLVQDYDHLVRYYSPEVMASRLIARDGDDFRIALRTRDRKVVSVVLDSEYEVRYGRLDAGHQFSWSRSKRIAEVVDAGGAHERAVPDGENHGYLWRLNSYWRFAGVDGGVIVQCEAISLTRDVPAGLGWLVDPFIRAIPRESLEATLGATRVAVVARVQFENAGRAEHR